MEINGLSNTPSVIKANIADLMKTLDTGDIIKARVLESKDGEITLRLPDGSVLTASAREDIEVEAGTAITLTVSSKSEGRLFLEIVRDTSQLDNYNSGILKNFLESLNITPDSRNLEIAAELLKTGVPITADIMDDALRIMDFYKGIDAPKAVFLASRGFQPSRMDTELLIKFLDGDFKIGEQLDELQKLFGLFAGESAGEGENAGIRGDAAGAGAAGEAGVPAEQGAVPAGTAEEAEPWATPAGGAAKAEAGAPAKAAEARAEAGAEAGAGAEAAGSAAHAGAAGDADESKALPAGTGAGGDGAEAGSAAEAAGKSLHITRASGEADGSIASGKATESTVPGAPGKASESSASRATGKAASGGKIVTGAQNAPEHLSEASKTSGSGEVISRPEGGRNLDQVKSENQIAQVKSALEQLFIKIKPDGLERPGTAAGKPPDSLAEKLDINGFQKELYHKLDMLKSILERDPGSLQAAESISAAAARLGNAARLMDRLNNDAIHYYYQLPVNLSGSNTTAEIYIMKNKKNSKRGGRHHTVMFVSLDTVHIGRIETLIYLQEKNASVNLRMENEEIKSFVKDNIKYLYMGLSDCGYKLTDIKYSISGGASSPIDIESLLAGMAGTNYGRLDMRI